MERGLKPNPYTPDISLDVHAAKGTRTRPLLDYWTSLCIDDRLPSWEVFDQMVLFDIAAYMAVLDVEGTPSEPRFRYRFIGTYLVQSREGLEYADPTGQRLEDIPRAYDYSPIISTYERCVMEEVPFLISGDFATFRQVGFGERMVVPLSNDGSRVDNIVTCLDRLREEDIC